MITRDSIKDLNNATISTSFPAFLHWCVFKMTSLTWPIKKLARTHCCWHDLLYRYPEINRILLYENPNFMINLSSIANKEPSLEHSKNMWKTVSWALQNGHNKTDSLNFETKLFEAIAQWSTLHWRSPHRLETGFIEYSPWWMYSLTKINIISPFIIWSSLQQSNMYRFDTNIIKSFLCHIMKNQITNNVLWFILLPNPISLGVTFSSGKFWGKKKTFTRAEFIKEVNAGGKASLIHLIILSTVLKDFNLTCAAIDSTVRHSHCVKSIKSITLLTPAFKNGGIKQDKLDGHFIRGLKREREREREREIPVVMLKYIYIWYIYCQTP